jgi:4-aminobutyrate aminotransferase-like enzyme
VKKVGAHMMNGLKKLQKKYPFIVDVRGRGLLLAIQFNSDMSQDILQRCLKEGLLVNAVKPNAIRIMPPLIITEKEIDKAIGIFDKVFSGIKS